MPKSNKVYSIVLTYNTGKRSMLCVKNRCSWKTLKTARYYSQGLIKAWHDVDIVEIESDCGLFYEMVECRQ